MEESKQIVVIIGARSAADPSELQAELTRALEGTGYIVEVSKPDIGIPMTQALARDIVRAMRGDHRYERAHVCVAVQADFGKEVAWYNRIDRTTVASMPAEELIRILYTDLTGRQH
jgi:hypothetical protein